MTAQSLLPLPEVPFERYGGKPLDKLRSTHGSDVLYTTPAYLIGKHYWRCTVYRHPSYGACTDWEWIRDSDKYGYDGSFFWNQTEDWPAYNSNASDGGLPKGTCRVYRIHQAEIQAAIVQAKGGV